MGEAFEKIRRRMAMLRRLVRSGLPGEVFSGDLSRWLERPIGRDELLSWWADLLVERERGAAPGRLQLYLHVPFCVSRCHYCQFDSIASTDDERQERFVTRAEGELKRLRESLGPVAVTNTSIGGGTPSLLSAGQLERLVDAALGRFAALRPGGYFSAELNPSSTTPEKVDVLVAAGANRFSLGVQSHSARVLALAGRGYQDGDSLRRAVAAIRRAGDAWLNLDLLAPLAGEDAAGFRAGVDAVLALAPDSITLYRYQPTLRKGRLVAPGQLPFEQASAILEERAAAAGLAECVVTRTCTIVLSRMPAWAAERYEHHPEQPGSLLGVGPFAESHVCGRGVYRTDLGAGDRWVFFGRCASLEQEARRLLVRALARGGEVDRAEFLRRFGRDVLDVAGDELEYLERRGAVVLHPERLRFEASEPERAGLLLDDATIAELAPAAPGGRPPLH